MKVTVCIGDSKWAIPFLERDKVRDVLGNAVARYAKHSLKSVEDIGSQCHFRTLDGAILDNDDLLSDVIDNNDTIKVVFASASEVEAPDQFLAVTQRYHKVLPKIMQLSTPPFLPPHAKFSTAPRHKTTTSKIPEEIFGSFTRSAARKSLGNSLNDGSWHEARFKVQEKQEHEALENVNISGNSISSSNKTDLGVDHASARRVRSDSTNLPSHELLDPPLSSVQSLSSLPPSSSPSKLAGFSGSRPKSAVGGYLTEFRGQQVVTKKIVGVEEFDEVGEEFVRDAIDFRGDDENRKARENFSSLRKRKGQPSAVLAPSNTRVIGKMLTISLLKGASGLGFTITSRDNMADASSPIYIKNILHGGSAHSDGKLKVLDRLLFVDGVDVASANQSEVTRLLRQISVGHRVELIISRQVSEEEEEEEEEEEDGEVDGDKGDFGEVTSLMVDHQLQHNDLENAQKKFQEAELIKHQNMTKEMEKFLSSSLSPSNQIPGEVWTVALSELLPQATCNLKPMLNDQQFVGMLIQASSSSPEFRLLEIDGVSLTDCKSTEECVELIKAAVNKDCCKRGAVMTKVCRPLALFESCTETKRSRNRSPRRPNVLHPLDRTTADVGCLKNLNETDIPLPPSSKSAPSTPAASKNERMLLDGKEPATFVEEVRSTGTFDRKGFGRQSMSEKRKGHVDPRSLDFYRHMSMQKMMKNLYDDGGDNVTSYATWDSRKAARMKKGHLKDVNAHSVVDGTKQYKSLEDFTVHQESLPPAAEAATLPNEVQVGDACKETNEPRPAELSNVSSPQSSDSDRRTVQKDVVLFRDKKCGATQEHKKFISYMKKTVENLRLFPKQDVGRGADASTTCPEEVSPATATQPSDATTPPDNDLGHKCHSSSLKFVFRSLPKRFSRAAWPFNNSKGEFDDGHLDGQPISNCRIQPEGREDIPKTQMNSVQGIPGTKCFGSEMSSLLDNKTTLAHIPVLRVEEVSNIYKDFVQHQQQNLQFSWQEEHVQEDYCCGEDSQYYDHQRPPNYVQQDMGQQVMHQHLPHNQQYLHSSPKQQVAQHFRCTCGHNLPSPIPTSRNQDYNTIIHRVQKSYDGASRFTPVEQTFPPVQMRPPNNQITPRISRDLFGFSQPSGYNMETFSPEMQHRTYLRHPRQPRYITTLKVNCEDESESLSENSIKSAQDRTYGYHLIQTPQHQNFHTDSTWTSPAHV